MSTATLTATPTLALHGGPRAISAANEDLFRWPIITPEDEAAVLEVLRAGKMSALDVTTKYEEEFAAWHGAKFALAHNNGTASLHAAMWACGVGAGDEVIGPSFTYWASVLPSLSLGAKIVFADVDPVSFNIDPKEIERRITPRTRAIVAVHYCGYPCDMDAIMAIARKHGIKVIEDVSHAHGGRYKGRMLGTIGDVAGFSLMSGKSLICGEGGMLLTSDPIIYERAIAFGHYERTGGPSRYTDPSSMLKDAELKKYAGIPLGGYKYRMNQLSSAVGRVQLKHYPARMAEIQKAMNRFCDLLEGIPGVRAHRVTEASSTMAGWYSPLAGYVPEEFNGLPVEKFCEALKAEGEPCGPGANRPLHSHVAFRDADIYRDGLPTMEANAQRGPQNGQRPVSQGQHMTDLPVTQAMPHRCFSIPWFKHDQPELIQQYADGIRKVAQAAKENKIH
jgi:dTDP-4-amino-4,6-dideoxygalactose transaminase